MPPACLLSLHTCRRLSSAAGVKVQGHQGCAGGLVPRPHPSISREVLSTGAGGRTFWSPSNHTTPLLRAEASTQGSTDGQTSHVAKCLKREILSQSCGPQLTPATTTALPPPLASLPTSCPSFTADTSQAVTAPQPVRRPRAQSSHGIPVAVVAGTSISGSPGGALWHSRRAHGGFEELVSGLLSNLVSIP